MTEKLYVSIDPGETTGLAAYDGSKWTWEQMGPNPHHLKLFFWLKQLHPAVVICEQFFYQRRREKVLLTSVQYIGVVYLYAQIRHSANDPVELVMQNPSDRDFWTDEFLQRLNLYLPGKPHANDATRHMLFHFTQHERDLRWIRGLKVDQDN